LLPSRVSLADDEALDSFIERLVYANDLRPAQVLPSIRGSLRTRGSTLAFFMTAPDQDVLLHIASLSGVGVEQLRTATLSRFDGGLPLRLDGLNPTRRHTYRNVVTQGWFPRFGSQACPECLRQAGIWSIYWRLPIVPVCLEHRSFLSTLCSGCGFRSHRYSPLRPILGPEQPCGNPVSLRNPCQHSVLAHTPGT
jgi:hypothetical protein